MNLASASTHFPDCFYRVSAKGLCVRDDKVLLIQDLTGRSDLDSRPQYELPGGGVDFGEGFAETLARELKEETGLTVSWIDERPLFIWSTKYEHKRGMEWFYVMTVVYLFDVVDLNFSPTVECKEIQFFSLDELKERIDELALQVRPLIDVFHPGMALRNKGSRDN